MLFITLIRLRKKFSKADMERVKNGLKESEKIGSKILSMYFTLGRYDCVIVSDCPDEKTHMKISMEFGDLASSETMVAIPAEEAEKLMD
ncbi:MAG: GYD domain-containing protein [Candidatus Bathyarchaeota archaeon]|nr:GYD domain-containing protein [Candidatus Bathyarchaeota archaeon]